MRYTSYKTKTNKTKTQHRKQRVNQELTAQRNWIHEIHKLQDEKQKHNIENRESIYNTRRRQTKQKHNIEQVTRRRQTK